MTGFARVEATDADGSWAWEARSVNGRSLDIRCRIANGFERLEPLARAEAAKRFKRGSITVGLTVARGNAAPQLRLNRALLDDIIAVARDLDPDTMPRIDVLLTVRGVIEPVDAEVESSAEALQGALERGLATLLDQLHATRRAEGARLQAVLLAQLDRIAELVAAAEQTAAVQPETVRARLRAQVAALLDAAPSLPEDRLAQETAVLLGKADVREELDRLTAHIAQARELLSAGGPIGRRLDFLCQEFNREANTLCSKSADVALTRIGLDLKTVIEHFREQVQNIE